MSLELSGEHVRRSRQRMLLAASLLVLGAFPLASIAFTAGVMPYFVPQTVPPHGLSRIPSFTNGNSTVSASGDSPRSP